MARTSVATDDFNRASLGTDWAQLNAVEGSIQITGSQYVYGPNALGLGQEQSARWVGAGAFTDDQYSSLKLVGLTWLTTDYYIGVIARASGDTGASRDYYGVAVLMDASGSKSTTLFKVVNGSYTSLYTSAQAWSSGDRLELECEGTTIRVLKNGTLINSSYEITDSSISSGAPGVCGAGGSTITGDDWEGGNIGGASIVPHARFMLTGIG